MNLLNLLRKNERTFCILCPFVYNKTCGRLYENERSFRPYTEQQIDGTQVRLEALLLFKNLVML